ncbi:hypothetical protein VTK73DRAFT_7733 [Phialemonium thermophilum]|uniref:Uncharacterized protein n=1 Tax=Phialemonium thermophilum TaxID=223376 RepID=A0ABR3WD40_9PEZI
MVLRLPRFPPLFRRLHPSSPDVRSSRPSRQLLWSQMAAPFSFLNLSVLVAFVLLCAVLNSARPDGLVTQGLSVAARSGGCCTSQDLPNPLATVYPNNATGVLNATLMIVPISLSTARRLIPSEYGILEHAYRALMPGFPQGMYPVLVQAAHDHDIQLRALDIRIDDFSVGLPHLPYFDPCEQERSTS